MNRKLAWLLVPLLAVATWWIVRDRGAPPPTAPAPPTPIAANRAEPALAERATPTDQARPDRAGANPSLTTQQTATPSATVDAGSGTTSATSQPPRGAAARARDLSPGLRPKIDDDAPAGKFTDRTNWGDASVAKQLDREFMPLASECIDQAKARDPRLEGLLSFTMVIAPTDAGKAIVAALKIRPDNQIADPELFECIRESSFALEGLKAPHDFDITMPIKPGD